MLSEIEEIFTREGAIEAIRNHCDELPDDVLADVFVKLVAQRADGTGGSAAEATHYQALPMQPIEIMQRLMSEQEFRGFLWGNVIKYALRCGRKDAPAKEMDKARQYAEWYVRAANGETILPPSRVA